jgi:predicted nucleic acid-binding protein
MILYLNTSALVKLYMEEPGSEAVRALLERAQVVSTSRVAYVEMRAGLARKLRQGELREEEYRHILSDFEKDWKNYFVIEVSEGVAQWGGELVGKNILFGPSMSCILLQRFSLGSGYAEISFLLL